MRVIHPTAALEPLAIPRHVRNLNAIAERAGMSVTMRAAPLYDDDPQPRLVARWEGTLEHLVATGLIVPHAQKRLAAGAGRRCELSVPSGEVSNALLMGAAQVSGERVAWEIDWGPALYSIEQRGGVEIITYSTEVVYHGSAEALVTAGIPRKHLPTGKHTGKSRWHGVEGPEAAWQARRQPDGMYLYRRESDEVRRARCEREAARQRQHDECPSKSRSPAPQRAVDWKQAEQRSCAAWIRAMVISLEGKSQLEPRFRLEEAALQRIRALSERFSRDLLAEIDQARVVDAEAPKPGLRLVWNGGIANRG